MGKKAIVHVMTKMRMKSDLFSTEIDAIEALSENYGVKNIICYKWEQIEYIDLINRLEKFGILFCHYSNKEELKEKLSEYQKEYEIAFVSTPLEILVNLTDELKQHLGQSVSEHANIFRDKHLQRHLIQEHNPELGIKFLKWEHDELDVEEIENKIWYPYIIKPIDGVQSSWVGKINNRADFEEYMTHYQGFHDKLKSKGIDTHELIVEEFIDGQLYSIDYFVDQNGETFISKPVKVKLGIDIDVQDYCNIARIVSEKTEEDFKWKRLKTFINATIKATGVKNTFVHHEFKINSKGEFKTIELNGRIGWGRLEVMLKWYGLNLYEFIVNPEVKPGKLKNNVMWINIYATKQWILNGFNQAILDKISKRESVYTIETDESALWKEIWLTKDGFEKIWVIKIMNKDYKTLRKDYMYIKKHYKDLLEITVPLIDNATRTPSFEAVKKLALED